MRPLIVTIDGPAGTGKSTVSRRAAERLDLPHLDTGAFYRAAALVAVRAAVDLDDESAVAGVVTTAFFDQIEGKMLVDGEDVSREIRVPSIASASSTVAAHPRVRAALVEHQRCWVELHGGSAVVEGRDIGSVVFPEAAVKIFLEADATIRAERRARETGQELDAAFAEQERRDHRDSSRPDSPLTIPEGATVVDTSSLNIDQVVDRVVQLAEVASS